MHRRWTSCEPRGSDPTPGRDHDDRPEEPVPEEPVPERSADDTAARLTTLSSALLAFGFLADAGVVTAVLLAGVHGVHQEHRYARVLSIRRSAAPVTDA
jgi:hypothetical protein